ncbi:hypothetical protein [Kitasatospora sp. NPDC056531]|uniref:hypothetical protein n=1 Tax=Kitasatospora sp. NPDC056531 TaxID=3345856 RepID=UPI0036BB8C39
MSTLRTGLTGIAALLLVGATTAAATQSNANAAPTAPAAVSGIAKLHTIVNLPPGTWTDTPLEVTLPQAGTYELDADVRGRLAGNPSLNVYMSARLWNVTAAAEVPESERLVYQIINGNPGTAQAGGNQTAPISELIRVSGPTTIRLQAQEINAVGAATVAQVYSDGVGFTALRYDRVGP